MRTTITLDDGLAADLKRWARREGRSVSAVIAAPFRLVTVRGGGPRPGVDLRKLRGLDEIDDRERFRRPRR